MAPAPPWAQLPLDLLGCILQRLPAMDHLSFAAVCTAWKAAASSGLYRPAPHPPWLMLPDPKKRHRMSFARFFSPLPGRRACTVRHPDPRIRGGAWIGSSADGWVVTADDRSELHLLNPLTGVRFELPSVTTFPFVEATRQGGAAGARSPLSYRLSRLGVPSMTVPACDLRFFIFVKAIAWWTPSSRSRAERDYTVALIYRPFERLAFARSGDTAWRTVDLLYAYGFSDLIFHRGWLLTVDGVGQVAAWDLAEGPAAVPRMLQARPPADALSGGRGLTLRSIYLVKSAATGALLQVMREGKLAAPGSCGGHYHTTGFRVFRLDVGRVRWVEVEDLGGEALFLGRGHSAAAVAAGVDGNSVFFTDDCFGGPELLLHWEGRDMGVFRMEDGSVATLSDVDLPPGPPSPIWVTPSVI